MININPLKQCNQACIYKFGSNMTWNTASSLYTYKKKKEKKKK
jgi:hypothetical protein